jgi:hypothetical protein
MPTLQSSSLAPYSFDERRDQLDGSERGAARSGVDLKSVLSSRGAQASSKESSVFGQPLSSVARDKSALAGHKDLFGALRHDRALPLKPESIYSTSSDGRRALPNPPIIVALQHDLHSRSSPKSPQRPVFPTSSLSPYGHQRSRSDTTDPPHRPTPRHPRSHSDITDDSSSGHISPSTAAQLREIYQATLDRNAKIDEKSARLKHPSNMVLVKIQEAIDAIDAKGEEGSPTEQQSRRLLREKVRLSPCPLTVALLTPVFASCHSQLMSAYIASLGESGQADPTKRGPRSDNSSASKYSARDAAELAETTARIDQMFREEAEEAAAADDLRAQQSPFPAESRRQQQRRPPTQHRPRPTEYDDVSQTTRGGVHSPSEYLEWKQDRQRMDVSSLSRRLFSSWGSPPLVFTSHPFTLRRKQRRPPPAYHHHRRRRRAELLDTALRPPTNSRVAQSTPSATVALTPSIFDHLVLPLAAFQHPPFDKSRQLVPLKGIQTSFVRFRCHLRRRVRGRRIPSHVAPSSRIPPRLVAGRQRR